MSGRLLRVRAGSACCAAKGWRRSCLLGRASVPLRVERLRTWDQWTWPLTSLPWPLTEGSGPLTTTTTTYYWLTTDYWRLLLLLLLLWPVAAELLLALYSEFNRVEIQNTSWTVLYLLLEPQIPRLCSVCGYFVVLRPHEEWGNRFWKRTSSRQQIMTGIYFTLNNLLLLLSSIVVKLLRVQGTRSLLRWFVYCTHERVLYSIATYNSFRSKG